MMMSSRQAREFAAEWIDAWNARDLERVLSHYADDFEFSSPLIVEIMNEPSGTLKGKDKVRVYWQTALARFSELRFELIDVLAGARSVTIYYQSVSGRKAAEVFIFDDFGKVCRSFAHYDFNEEDN